MFPNADQCVAMSTVDSPVTQMTDTAVKRASWSGVIVRSADAIGSENNSVNSRINAVKIRMANREGELRARPSMASRMRPYQVVWCSTNRVFVAFVCTRHPQ